MVRVGVDADNVGDLNVDAGLFAGFADRFVIATVNSTRQMNAVIDAMDEKLKPEGIVIRRREGDPDSGWVLLDMNDIVLHLFGPEERAFYDLESLWGKTAPVVRFQ